MRNVSVDRINTAQRGDALALLRSLPSGCSPLVFFDPQHRAVLDRLKFGNEGERQKGRAKLPAMTNDYIDACCREAARVLSPSGYLMRWVDTFGLCEAQHLRIADITGVGKELQQFARKVLRRIELKVVAVAELHDLQHTVPPEDTYSLPPLINVVPSNGTPTPPRRRVGNPSILRSTIEPDPSISRTKPALL